MGLFALFVIIPVILICALVGVVCLWIAKIPITLISVSVFTFIGGAVGVATMIIWGFIFSNTQGQLDTKYEVLGMYIVAGLLAVISALFISAKYFKLTKRDHDTHG